MLSKESEIEEWNKLANELLEKIKGMNTYEVRKALTAVLNQLDNVSIVKN